MMPRKWSKDRLADLEAMLLSGTSMEVCGEHFGCSKARISEVRRIHLPNLKIVRDKTARKLEAKRAEVLETYGRSNYFFTDPKIKALTQRFNVKKAGALRKGIAFDLKLDEVVWPTHCPILQLELDYAATKRKENSPSFDRIDSCRGYVKGNVAIISWRANRIKNDGTAEELEAIAHWMRKVKTT